jgi:hypothetical protein
MEMTMSESFRVMPAIGRLNKYLQRAKKVALSSIDPVYQEIQGQDARLEGFNIKVEGPARYLSYFSRLIDEGNLKLH